MTPIRARGWRRAAAAAGLLAALLAVLAVAGGVARAHGRGELVVRLRVLHHGRSVIALVPVTIDGKGPFTFALDTGASRSLVDSAVAKRLEVRRKGPAGRIAGVNAVSKAALVKVQRWRAGGVTLPAATIVSSNIPFGNARGGIQGLLGSDVLSRFDVVTIDYRRQELRLRPR